MQFSLQHINNFNLLKRYFIKYFKTHIANHINNIIRPFKTKKRAIIRLPLRKINTLFSYLCTFFIHNSCNI